MKRTILSLFLTFSAGLAFSQVSFFVQEPAAAAGGYEISYANQNGGTSWGSPDMLDPANLVTGIMCMADDSLACEPLTNGSDLDGKIAVVYRGDCQFGTKALQCQNEGAIACIVINHSPGVIPMGGADDGLSVTIPVIMISNEDGAAIYDDVISCSQEAIIGNLNGYFANNLRLTNATLLRPESYGRVAGLNLDDSEFDVELGSWVYNFGQSEETAAVLNVTVTHNNVELYNESSDPTIVPVGDSVFIAMPTFSQTSYPVGDYDVTYSVSGTGDDDFVADNAEPANFVMGNSFSYSRLNDEGFTWPTNYTSPAETVGARNFCIFFSDPNASRATVNSIQFSGTHFTETIEDMDVEAIVYEWDDEFMGTDTSIDDVSEVETEGYTFVEGDDDAIISLDFFNPIELEDDQNYLFCITHENEDLQLGYDNKTNYEENLIADPMPLFPQFDDGNQFTLGFGGDLIPAISVQMTTVTGLADNSEPVELTPYPNPANEILTIPFTSELRGQALMTVFSAEGKMVSQETINVNAGQLQVDVTTLANGNYLFDLQFEDNKESAFSVMINR